jgi:hypothetical protein
MNQQELVQKWQKVILKEGYDPINDDYKARVTARLLENQAGNKTRLDESGAPNSVTANVDKFDPVLIKMVRRMAPKLIAYDVCGVQPLDGPSGLIFALRSRYNSKTGNEALYGEANTAHSGQGTHLGTDPFAPEYSTGAGMPTATAEGDTWNEMSFSIEKTNVVADSHQLKATWSEELAQDYKHVHGGDAESELTNILTGELTSELNRKVLRTIYTAAKLGCTYTQTPGTYNLDADADGNGRWFLERVKTFLFAIEREANAVALDSWRGRANIIICSSDVASAISMVGLLDADVNIQNSLEVDPTGTTYIGTYKKVYKVYVDPYVTVDFMVLGYKGANHMDAGIFYCPYIPLTMVRATDPTNFQPAIGFKTRSGIVANPFTTLAANSNSYYRKIKILGL